MKTLEIATVAVGHDIREERRRQEQLRITENWGPLEKEDYHVLHTVLSEEVGEVARGILEVGRASSPAERKRHLADLKAEAIQTAATAAQIAEKVTLELDLLG